ncbi:MAG: hypothetical protein AAGC64_03355 [Bacteroidota bacterium]
MISNLKSIFFSIVVLGATALNAQKAKTVSLVQIPEAFETTELKLEAGKPYIFEVENNGVDRKVGFVVAPKGQTEQKNHVKEAYLKKAISNGETAISGVVTLEAGEYVYFCPLNPTPFYTLIVE